MARWNASGALAPVAWGALGAVLVDRLARFLASRQERKGSLSPIGTDTVCEAVADGEVTTGHTGEHQQQGKPTTQWELELKQKGEQLQRAERSIQRLRKSNEFLTAQVEQLEQNLMMLSVRESQKVQHLQQELEQALEYAKSLETEYAILEKDFDRFKSSSQAAARQEATPLEGADPQEAQPATEPAVPQALPLMPRQAPNTRSSGEDGMAPCTLIKKTQSDVLPYASCPPPALSPRADLPDITDPNFQGPRVKSVVKAIEGWSATLSQPPAVPASAAQ